MNALDRNLEHFSNAHAALMLVAVAATLVVRTGLFVAVECLLLFGWLIFRQRQRLRRHAYPPGLANVLTLARLLILIGVLLQVDALSPAAVFAAFAANIALDVVDGRLARARNESDRFGAHFDMEVDAVYVLVAGVYFHLATGIGAWVLVPGLLRYLYRLAVWQFADTHYAERRRRYAAVIAGVSFTLLCAAVVLPAPWQLAALLATLALLCASFTASFAELVRHASRRPSVQ